MRIGQDFREVTRDSVTVQDLFEYVCLMTTRISRLEALGAALVVLIRSGRPDPLVVEVLDHFIDDIAHDQKVQEQLAFEAMFLRQPE
jgi:hypothetical protein